LLRSWIDPEGVLVFESSVGKFVTWERRGELLKKIHEKEWWAKKWEGPRVGRR